LHSPGDFFFSTLSEEMNVLKIFRRRSQSAPLKPSKDVLSGPSTPSAPIRNLLLLIDLEKDEIEKTLGTFKGSILSISPLFFFFLGFLCGLMFLFFSTPANLKKLTLEMMPSLRRLATALCSMWASRRGTRTLSKRYSPIFFGRFVAFKAHSLVCLTAG